MSMNINKMTSPGGGSDLGDPRIGAHYSRFVGFAYLGVHDRKAWQGTPKDPCGKSILIFELLDDFCEIDGVQRPRWISKKENAFSSQNSNLTKIYNLLDPTGQYAGGFDKMVAATVPCMVNIEGKVDFQTKEPIPGVKIGSISACATHNADGTDLIVPPVQNPVIIYDFDEPTAEAYAGLKAWMQREVKAANNYAGSAAERIAVAHDATVAAQANAASAAAPAAGAPVQQQQAAPALQQQGAPAPLQQPAPQQPAPVVQQAAAPAAPPGFRYDATTNTFVADTAAQQSPPAGGSPAY